MLRTAISLRAVCTSPRLILRLRYRAYEVPRQSLGEAPSGISFPHSSNELPQLGSNLGPTRTPIGVFFGSRRPGCLSCDAASVVSPSASFTAAPVHSASDLQGSAVFRQPGTVTLDLERLSRITSQAPRAPLASGVKKTLRFPHTSVLRHGLVPASRQAPCQRPYRCNAQAHQH